MIFRTTVLLTLFSFLQGSVVKEILKETAREFVIKITIHAEVEADVFPTSLLLGLPSSEIPVTSIQFLNKSTLPFQSKQSIEPDFEWINQQTLQNLHTGSIRISPLANESEYFKTIIATFQFSERMSSFRDPTHVESIFLKRRVINWDSAKKWFIKESRHAKKTESLPEGKWIQFFLNEDGMTSINFEDLSAIYPNLSSTDPRSYSLFMSEEYGRSRTQFTNQDIPENLVEISIKVEGEEDGSFDPDDKIIFYGRGPSGFNISGSEIDWHQNVYFISNSCWLLIPNDTSERGNRIELSEPPSSISITLDYGILSYRFESDLINLEASGTQWVGSPILAGGSQTILTNLSNPKPGVEATITTRLLGYSLSDSEPARHIISLFHNSISGDQIGTTVNWLGSTSRTLHDESPSLTLNDGSNTFFIRNTSTDGNSSPYLDYFELHYGGILQFSDSYEFTSPISNQDIRFFISGTQSTHEMVWDISDISNPTQIAISTTGTMDVSVPANTLSRFILFDADDLSSVSDLTLIENQEFNSIRQTGIQSNYIIVGPEQFRDESADLIDLRAPAIYAALETIYTEFSAGNKDPMAIRSFIQWTQEKWESPQPTILLLLGDGGYDYRNITGNSSIVVPTIQVQGSRTYATDDWFATLSGNIPEIALGRFPARNENEVTDFVEKVIGLESNPEFGPWRQRVTLVADDGARPEPESGSIETGKSHTRNSETLAALVPASFMVDKIYMLEYPEVSDASKYGVLKPDATQAVFDNLNKGTAIFSYIGHGSSYSLAQEKLLYLDRGDINQINTGYRMPLWIVGTCSFGHFDDPLSESFSEELIRDPMNAASMIISTTRKITISGNERYTREIFEALFEDGHASDLPIGVILQSIKDGSSEGQYFHLFGDPAMKLPMPKHSATISDINPDTLETLGIANFTGTQSTFSEDGTGYITLMDAQRNVTREYQIYSDTYSLSYTLPGATLFRGQFTFDGHEFSGDIRIPQDISYSNDPARLMVYVHGEIDEAIGVLDNIQLIGGQGTTDAFGPHITFETKSGRILETGDHYNETENLLIRISDPLGINLTNETGHEILLTDLDSDVDKTITDDFYYDPNSIQTGKIEIQTSNGGEINILVKAWDNANNPSEKQIHLSRTADSKLKIHNAYNFPNPFSLSTQFAFEVTNNADVQLDVFTLGGKRIRSFEKSELDPGYHTIDWDGVDAYGSQIANGVYLYRIKAVGEQSSQTYIGRCAKYR